MNIVGKVRAAAARHRILAGLLAAYLALSAVEFVRVLLFDRPRAYDAGFYPPEPVHLPEGGRTFAWTRGISGELLRPLYAPVVRIPLYLARPDIPPRGLHVWLSVDNRVFDEIVLEESGWHRLDYYLPAILGADPWRDDPARMDLAGVADLRPLAGDEPFLQPRWVLQRKPDHVRVFTDWGPPQGPPSQWLTVQVESSFKPSTAVDTSDMTVAERRGIDSRDLGIGVGELLWAPQVSEAGVGLWEEELEGDRAFRWSRGRASIAVPAAPGADGDGSPELVLLLRPAAPDADQHPVVATLWWQEELVASVTLRERSWQPIRLSHPRLDGTAGVLTLRVNRTWSQRRDAGGDDGRELGAAITAPYWER